MVVELVGYKRGMTRIFTDTGAAVPVSVIEVQPNTVVRLKNLERDGYCAVQVAAGSVVRKSRITKPRAGQFACANVQPHAVLREFRVKEAELAQFSVGQSLICTAFQEGQLVDVQGVSRGKGFAGAVKRYGFAMQDATHGNSLSHRAPGSIGQRQSPGKVFKGKRMSGHMGNARCTILSQKVVAIDAERACVLIEGSIPGAPGSLVVIRPAIKRSLKKA